MGKIIITGTGHIAGHLADQLKAAGKEIVFLSTTKSTFNGSPCFHWDISRQTIDENALDGVQHIIHLAGAGIADKRWTTSRKNEIIDSRIESANLLFDLVKKKNIQLKTFISASGIGYYGAQTCEKAFKETDPPHNDFISQICIQWEEAAMQFNQVASRVVILRTGVVFSKDGGALTRLMKPIKMGIGSPIGKGNQWMPWIHIKDLCRLYKESIESNTLKGVYNAVASEHITNKQLTLHLARSLDKKIILPNVPGFVLWLLFGQLSEILLNGSKVDNSKLLNTGFTFEFDSISQAIDEILKK